MEKSDNVIVDKEPQCNVPYARRVYTSKLGILKAWELFENERGCLAFEIAGICLQMEKSPPPLPDDLLDKRETVADQLAPLPSAPPTPPPAAKGMVAQFFDWVFDEPASDKEQAQAWFDKKVKALKPFDLYDIPHAMRMEGFTVGAKLAQRWLDGRAYSAYIKNAAGKDVEGRYDADMVDTDTVKLKWLRKMSAIDARYQTLLEALRTPKALEELHNKFEKQFLKNNGVVDSSLDTLSYCDGDLQTLHDAFQFQRSFVSMFDTLLKFSFGTISRYGRNIGMSDVTASLANFLFYAAVAKAQVRGTRYNRYNTPQGTVECVHHKIKVTHIYVYARDSYSFYDKGKASQYLGHWNETGLVILPHAAAASWGMKKIMDKHEADGRWDQKIEPGNATYTSSPIDLVGKLFSKDVYYPVRNRDYREWREKKGRGGDFLIYSDLELIKLDQPIELDMGEVCRKKSDAY